MRVFLGLLFLSICLSARAELVVLPVGKDTDWLYTVAVGKGGQHFGVSLMKNGLLAYTTWGSDGQEQPLKEKTFPLSPEQFQASKDRLDQLFTKFEAAGLKEKQGAPVVYSFEQVGEKESRTLNFSGHAPELIGFLMSMAQVHQIQYPFLL